MTPLVTANMGDLPVIQRIAHDAFAPYVPVIGKPPAPMMQDYAPFVAAGQVTRTRAKDGFVVLVPRDDHLYLDTIAVAPAAQGRGIGRQLLTHAIDYARVLGLPRVHLCTNAKMTGNIALYQRFGFQVTGRGQQDGFERVFFDLSIAPE